MTPEDMERLITRAENRIARSWRAFVRDVLDENSLADIERAVAVGDLGSIFEGVDAAAEALSADINGAFVLSGQRTSKWLDDSVRGTSRFGITDDNAVAWMTDQAETLERALASEAQDVAEHVVRHGRSQGWSDARIAQEVRSSFGLNATQVDTVNRYRTALETGDMSNALRRELADGRYDRALRNVRRGTTKLSPERIDSMVDAYRRNWLKERGETIALKEGTAAVHAGQQEALRQAVEAGLIPYASQTWHTRGDHKVRHSHRTMSGQQRNYGEAFVSGYGNALRYPGDEDAPLSETAHCRCLLVPSLQPIVQSKFRIAA